MTGRLSTSRLHLPSAEQADGSRGQPGGRDRVIVLANRAPFRHDYAADGRVTSSRADGGVVTALEPLIAACSGTWVAHGAGPADKGAVDLSDRLTVFSRASSYRLRYVWLENALIDGFYHGFSNEGLWPLCHAAAAVIPIFRPDDFRLYEIANARFASAVAAEANDGAPLVFVQDYHFALAPAMLRRLIPGSRIVTFWHIPWPTPRVVRSCPLADELLSGLLASDVVGVQTEEDGENLLASAEAIGGARVDRSARTVHRRQSVTTVRVCPVGVDVGAAALLSSPPPHECRRRLRRDLGLDQTTRLGVGVDRLDYTKGLTHKIEGIERLLEQREDLRGHFAFAQVASPTRDKLPAYRAARTALVDAVARVNARFGRSDYQPVHLLEAHHDADAVYSLYRAADVCVVSSLCDGMNLVAKEFVAARDDERGVLVLSQFAGAAAQLRAALPINPFDTAQSANTIARALAMSSAEQKIRMRLLRDNVRAYDASWWAREMLAAGAAQDKIADYGPLGGRMAIPA